MSVMQIVSKEILAELAKHSAKIHESDEQDFSFMDFNHIFQKQIEKSKDISLTFKFIEQEYLSHFCPPIRFVGDGSSRASYAMNDGLCLKVAKNDKGQAQNLQEYKMTKNPKYSCFAQSFECEKSGNSVLTECCAIGSEKDFFQKCDEKFNLHIFCEVIDLFTSLKDLRKCSNVFMKQTKDRNTWTANMAAESIACINWLLENKTAQAKILNEICRFYSEHSGNDLIVGDMMNIDNWGLAVRNGETCFIIIDAGLSGDVFDKYYLNN